jgi:DNA-binding response OmpR family regulator
VSASPNAVARILVVDDDTDLRRMLTLALTDEGYAVRAVENGRAALDMLETWRPRVILLDLMMPDEDGWAFRAQQLATPGVADVPVVILSAARDVPVDSLRPAAFVPKPFNLEQLLTTVANLAH